MQAERDAALELLDRLERAFARQGGHTSPEDQEVLRLARALLVETGKRKSDAPAVWKNRP